MLVKPLSIYVLNADGDEIDSFHYGTQSSIQAAVTMYEELAQMYQEIVYNGERAKVTLNLSMRSKDQEPIIIDSVRFEY